MGKQVCGSPAGHTGRSWSGSLGHLVRKRGTVCGRREPSRHTHTPLPHRTGAGRAGAAQSLPRAHMNRSVLSKRERAWRSDSLRLAGSPPVWQSLRSGGTPQAAPWNWTTANARTMQGEAGTPLPFHVRETRKKGSLPLDPQKSGTSLQRPGGSPVLLRTKAIPQPRQKRGMMRWVSSKTEERKIPFSYFQRLLISWSVKGTLMMRL